VQEPVETHSISSRIQFPLRFHKACAKYRKQRLRSSFAPGKTPQSFAKTDDGRRLLRELKKGMVGMTIKRAVSFAELHISFPEL